MNDSDKERALSLCPRLQGIRHELETYEDLLLRWQKKINLIGPSTVQSVWTRHFADSAQLAEFCPERASWADLGSGAGFPGIVISLLQKSLSIGGEMHVIESDSRKAAFLREVSRETGAGAVVHHTRCEDILPTLSPSVITSRAMTGLARLIELSREHVENGAIALFLKGRDIDVELTSAPISSNFSIELFQSRVDPGGNVIRISVR